METFVAVVAIVLGVVGILGSVAPALPGPPLGWVGLLCLYIWGNGTNGAGEPMGASLLLVWMGIVIVVSVLDYFVPAWFTKVTGGSRAGGWGAVIGLFAGLVFPPVGMILGSILGAFVAEMLIAGKDAATSVKSAFGAFLGFMFGTGIKLICSAVLLFYILVYAF